MRAGLLTTRPGPLTETVSRSVRLPNEARTRFSPSMVTVHDVLRPEQAPVQPRKTASPLGRASKRTLEPLSNSAEQTDGHSSPAGTLVTWPAHPAATRSTVSMTGPSWGNGDTGCQSSGASAKEAVKLDTWLSPLPSRFIT